MLQTIAIASPAISKTDPIIKSRIAAYGVRILRIPQPLLLGYRGNKAHRRSSRALPLTVLRMIFQGRCRKL